MLKGQGNAPGSSSDGDMSDKGALEQLRMAFGCRFLMMIGYVQFGIKGFVWAMCDQSQPYLYKAYNVPAAQVQIYNGVTMLAWAMKPIVGLITDVFPIGGLNKAPYMIIASIWGAGAFLYVGITPQVSLSLIAIVVCIFIQNMMMATTDLLSEAKYAEKIQQNPSQGPNMTAFAWIGLQVASVFAYALSGQLVNTSAQLPYLICAIPVILLIIPLALGQMDEKTKTAEEISETRRRFAEQKETTFLCGVMFMATVVLFVCGLVTQDPYINCFVSIGVGIKVLVSFSVLLSPTIAKFNAFSLIQTSLGLSISGASFYFYTDTPEQYPEGPHFSKFFFTTVMGAGGAVACVVGVVLYTKCFSHWPYRSLLVATNIAASFLSFLDILMFTRTNSKLGIPDHFFIVGNGALETVIYQCQWMPQIVILSYMCPPGMEATMFALLAGCHNLGQTISGSVGALVLHLLEVNPKGAPGESAQFDNLWKASLISTVLPLMVVFLLFKLLPDRQQNENLLVNSSVTEGSLLQRWRGQAANADERLSRTAQADERPVES